MLQTLLSVHFLYFVTRLKNGQYHVVILRCNTFSDNLSAEVKQLERERKARVRSKLSLTLQTRLRELQSKSGSSTPVDRKMQAILDRAAGVEPQKAVKFTKITHEEAAAAVTKVGKVISVCVPRRGRSKKKKATSPSRSDYGMC